MNIIKRTLIHIPLFKTLANFRKRYNEPNSVSLFKFLFFYIMPVQILTKFCKNVSYMPKDKYSSIIRGNVFIGKCTRIQRSGCYIQGRGKVYIGNYAEFASNVAIISGNHDLYNQDVSVKKETIIGDYCWIATNACILAGVVLGPRTIVGAGSVVTKSFPDGNCVIAGNPAKIIKYLEPDKVVKTKDEEEFYGYLPEKKFRKYFKYFYSKLSFDYDISKVSDTEFFKKNNNE